MKIDLHSHSNRSDGKETPTEVFEWAAKAGLEVLALTDHDTTSGWDEAEQVAKRLGMGFLPGIEVTTEAQIAGRSHRISVHMLAYLPNPEDQKLIDGMGGTVETRVLRAQQITERLGKDFNITWQHVLDQLRPGATIGRPAIADALVELGHAADRSDAFNFLLSERGPYFVPHTAPDTLEMIGTIRAAGGVPVIAHPLTGFTEEARRKNLPQEHFEQLIAAGLAGFEVFHRDVPELAREWLLDLAQHHDLIVTGSSDYHGVSGKPNRLGENMTDPEMLERILQQGSGTHPRF